MKRCIVLAAVLALIFSACDSQDPITPQATSEPDSEALSLSKKGDDPDAQLLATMDAVNAALANNGADYRVVKAEWIGNPEANAVGNTVIAKDVGNKQLDFDFIPGDTRRAWSGSGGTAITYAIDQTGDAVPPFGGLTGADTDAAIVRAMDTWNTVNCSDLGLTRNPDFGLDIGVVAFIFGLGGSPFVFADVQHAGWRDIDFAGGVLGVTFTFGFVDSGGNFTDVDNNGKLDAAFREIYYDPSFSWADDGSSVDVESIALHEAGHGLSQAHFGKVFIDKKGRLKFAPRAVMNAVYTGGSQRDLLGTDNGGHCSIWANWPNN